MEKSCCTCKNFTFSLEMDDIYCLETNKACPYILNCDKWIDKYFETRCDNWREYNLYPKRHSRYKTLDKFGKYMKKKYHVYLWTSEAEAHDIMGNHIGW